jgi:hypothetical protein
MTTIDIAANNSPPPVMSMADLDLDSIEAGGSNGYRAYRKSSFKSWLTSSSRPLRSAISRPAPAGE